jgi:hypothetical protein
MKIYIDAPKKSIQPCVKQITILASPQELRRISRFIENAADLMEKHGEDYGHEHLQDYDRKDDERYPDIIIGKPQLPS